MSEPVYLTRDDGEGRWIEWHANSATHLALPADEFRALQARLDAAEREHRLCEEDNRVMEKGLVEEVARANAAESRAREAVGALDRAVLATVEQCAIRPGVSRSAAAALRMDAKIILAHVRAALATPTPAPEVKP